ncbi:P-loop containing nucleoside triphosphate hydrolase protein [Sistotremastrum niveocremeum HHB9708]|uniref:RNA helicase n=1 Tax=Sistotremastrum niveocremeum HHB9708 TaxID=1314777 RepID=A0A165AII1_9AGAM|nr:P-loop containing nucleoside triphosphate hydrolase protein [Sistotremastrum niveocremeum HHB9708]
MATKVPLSIESLLQKQREEKEATAKPRFLSKEERAKIAIAKRAAEIKEDKTRAEKQKEEHEKLQREADSLRHQEWEQFSQGSRYQNRHDDRDSKHSQKRDNRRDDRDRDRKESSAPAKPAFQNGIPTGPRADRNKAAPASNSSASSLMPPPPNPTTSEGEGKTTFSETPSGSNVYVPPISDNDLTAIRSRYLGVDKKKRKIRKMNDRKFVFDWDEQEDTFTAESPSAIGSQRQGAAVMFGRGHLAGMDDDGRRGSGPEVRHVDAMERRSALKSAIDERHWSEKPLAEMKERDWRIFREDFSGQIPHPLRSWQESTIPEEILAVVDSVGYKEPSAIQRQAIPVGLQKRDVIGIAETGSGKTASFVIPMLSYIMQLPPLTDANRHLGPYALILAPTRELAQQIEGESKKFATPLGYKCVSIVGGRAVEEQQFNLREGAEIIIATPGRLKDVIDRHVLVLSQCTYVVMDEADRMVHLGFEADLTMILDALPSDTLEGEDQGMKMEVDGEGEERMVKKGRTRVTTLFSATMPAAVERLARKYLRKPAVITIGEAGRAVDTVEQRVEFVNGDEKKKLRLVEILNTEGHAPPIIVFVNQKKTADMVARDLQRANEWQWSASTLHSGKNQEQREAALAALRSGEVDVLVATDLAGRGIDVQDVSLVVNYQMASTIEAYVHRIGRTGRAGKLGTAITFLTNDDDEVMYDLKQEISKSPVSKVPPELARHEAAQNKVSREMKRKRDAEDQG